MDYEITFIGLIVLVGSVVYMMIKKEIGGEEKKVQEVKRTIRYTKCTKCGKRDGKIEENMYTDLNHTCVKKEKSTSSKKKKQRVIVIEE
jgi:hypothetical protein